MMLKEATDTAKQLEVVKRIICSLKSNTPRMVTDGKIPDSNICFLDEIFKSNDGILNSLLTALNEHKYTNEGQTVDIPVISFFSASNEIPNFKDSSQAILVCKYTCGGYNRHKTCSYNDTCVRTSRRTREILKWICMPPPKAVKKGQYK